MKRIDLVKVGGFVPNENLVATEVDAPKPSSDKELVIDVKASAVNPVDWKQSEFGFFLPDPLPAALGCDVAGICIQGPAEMVGKRVVTYLGASKVSSGTQRGAFVDQVVSDVDVTFEIPSDEMTFAQAASLPVGALTASFLLDAHESVKEGDWFLVWGASSSVGYNAVQLAADKGLKVIAIASSKHKDAVTDVGATAFVDYTTDDVAAKVAEIVSESGTLNGAVDCIGSETSHGTSAALLAQLGKKDSTLVVSTTNFGLKPPPDGVVSRPVNLGSALEVEKTRGFIRKVFPEVLKVVKPQKLRLVKGPLAAETVAEAFQTSKDGVSGEKVVIEWTK